MVVSNEINTVKRNGAFEKRIHEVDFLRGLLMILVIMDHLFINFAIHGRVWYNSTGLDFFYRFYNFFSFYNNCVARSLIRQLVLFGFTFISGISCAFSKSNWKRAGLMVLVYFGVSVATNMLHAFTWQDGSGAATRIDFNIIGVLAWSTLIYCFFQNKSWKSLVAFLLISIVITIGVIPTLLAIPNMEKAFVPALWSPEYLRSYFDFNSLSFVYNAYPNNSHITLGIRGGDYLPLFPYISFFFMGAIVSYFIYQNKKSIFKNRYNFERPFCFIGRHAIWFYLFHQVIFFPIFYLLDAIIK